MAQTARYSSDQVTNFSRVSCDTWLTEVNDGSQLYMITDIYNLSQS